MAHNPNYQPVNVDMIGLEDGRERFKQDGMTMVPRLARWRNNLTALSHHRNLFFIANEACISVFEPEFPYQTLRSQPVLTIKPELANQHAPGYLSSLREGILHHCINHLVVGELGSQEILVLATDSGNIVAYYTKAILEAADRIKSQSYETKISDAVGLRPFFSYWVRQSAWGIDIHKDARMIAVSSNVPNPSQPACDEDNSATITVFAFALTDNSQKVAGSSPEDERQFWTDDTQWMPWCPTSQSHARGPRRDRNYKVTLASWNGHRDNVPNISFYKKSDDEGGLWLLSTDITGLMKLWNLWKLQCFRTWNFGAQDVPARPWLHREYSGWNVAAIDLDCFRPVKSNEEFIGANKAPMYYGYNAKGPSFNLTPIVSRLPDNSEIHPSRLDATDEALLTEEDQMFGDMDESEDEEDEVPDIEQSAREVNAETMEDVQSPGATRLAAPDILQMTSEYSGSHTVDQFDQTVEFEVETDYDSEDSSSVLSDEEAESQGSTSPRSPPPPPRILQMLRRHVTPIQDPHAEIPNMALIHCTDTHISMLSSPRANFPHVFCANILKQLLPDNVHLNMQGLEFAYMTRLNMLHQIPELGLLLVATQTGRVALCALTRRQDDVLAFRVDCVLPTKQQERRGFRPEFCTLTGMAVAPIQGHSTLNEVEARENVRSHDEDDEDSDSESTTILEDSEVDGVQTTFDHNMVVLRRTLRSQERHAWTRQAGTPPKAVVEKRVWRKAPVEPSSWQASEVGRRYRLMLTYSDLSVLTYEISRHAQAHEIG